MSPVVSVVFMDVRHGFLLEGTVNYECQRANFSAEYLGVREMKERVELKILRSKT
jgi:hypothetical protein